MCETTETPISTATDTTQVDCPEESNCSTEETTEETSTSSTKKKSTLKKILTVIWQAIVAAITAWTASSCMSAVC